MHSAPSVTFPVGRSRFAGALLLVLWLLGLSCGFVWWTLFEASGWRLSAMAAVLVASGAVAVHAWRSFVPGELSWDGSQWSWDAGQGALTGTVDVALDLQNVLLLCLHGAGTARAWFWLERSALPQRWGDVRRAVYSRARPEAPSPAGQSASPS